VNLVVDRLVELMAQAPDPVLPAVRVGARRPASGTDVPSVSVSLTIDDARGAGVGEIGRAAAGVVQSTALVPVAVTPTSFTADLRTLRLEPPVRRNPASPGTALGESDVRVRNVTDAAHPAVYHVAEQPSLATEYVVDVSRARLRFGAAQHVGDTLEVAYWTVRWRDDIEPQHLAGSMLLEVWGASAAETEDVSRRLQARLRTARALLKEKGFLRVSSSRLEAMEGVLLSPPVGSALPVWRQRLEYRFAFEGADGGAVSSGGPIRRIDVGVDDGIGELFSLP